MKRPSFQFYPCDWRINTNLRRCSFAARGAWIDVMCALHDSDEYGVARWPLSEIASVANVPIELINELVAKNVLKGSDGEINDFTHTVRHAGKDGDTHVLIPACSGPCWFSSRMVVDEWRRNVSGGETRFGSPDRQPSQRQGVRQGSEPSGKPSRRQGHGSTSSSSSSSTKNNTYEEVLAELTPKYPHANVQTEGQRAMEWCQKKKRNFTKAFFANWLKKIEAPIQPPSDFDRLYAESLAALKQFQNPMPISTPVYNSRQ